MSGATFLADSPMSATESPLVQPGTFAEFILTAEAWMSRMKLIGAKEGGNGRVSWPYRDYKGPNGEAKKFDIISATASGDMAAQQAEVLRRRLWDEFSRATLLKRAPHR
jgi:hypothetical protein